MPLTFVLPYEITSFLSAYSSTQNTCQERQSTLWIMKPSAMSKGRGISIVDDIGKVIYSSPTVIQQYLRNPLLLQGYKFDLRIYILVTSISPLEALIYKKGFARIGSRKFSSHTEHQRSTDSFDKFKHTKFIHSRHLARGVLENIEKGWGRTKSWGWSWTWPFELFTISFNLVKLLFKFGETFGWKCELDLLIRTRNPTLTYSPMFVLPSAAAAHHHS